MPTQWKHSIAVWLPTTCSTSSKMVATSHDHQSCYVCVNVLKMCNFYNTIFTKSCYILQYLPRVAIFVQICYASCSPPLMFNLLLFCKLIFMVLDHGKFDVNTKSCYICPDTCVMPAAIFIQMCCASCYPPLVFN